MDLLVHVIEERKRGDEDENVNGGEQAEQKDDFAFTRFQFLFDRIGFSNDHKLPAA